MRLFFNLAQHIQALTMVSSVPEVAGLSILQDICLDNGFPLPPSPYDRNLSWKHTAVYELIKCEVDNVTFLIPAPEHAVLTSQGGLMYTLDIY